MIAIPRGSWHTLVASFLLCSSSAAALAATEDGCEIPAGIEETVSRLGDRTRECGRDAECLKGADAEWQALLAKYPQSVPLHRQYQGAWTKIDRERIMREYRQILDAHPDAPYALTLCARTFDADRKDERIALLTKALELDPRYPWAHFSFGWLYGGLSDPMDIDVEKAKPHVLAFAEACPNSLLVRSLVRAIGDRAFEAKILEIAHVGLAQLPPEQAVARYSSTWEGWFRIAPPSEHAAVRERVRTEVERLRAMKQEDSRVWWSALEQGYKLTGDKAAQMAAQDEIARRFPCESDALRFAVQGWEREHPRPAVSSSKEWTERNDARYAFTRGLVERCPRSLYAWSNHYADAVAKTLLPRKELERIIDTYLDLYGGSTTLTSWPSPYQRVAELYMDRAFRLDRVHALLEKDRQQAERHKVEPSAKANEEERAKIALEHRETDWRLQRLRVRADLSLGLKKERDAGLTRLETMMKAETDARAKGVMAAQYAWLQADVATSENRWADAFSLYQEAADGLPGESRVKTARANAWRLLGGSEASLARLVAALNRSAVVTKASSWHTVDRSLPAATLDRLGGGQWTTAAFAGKRTLVNFWATWCGPCKNELPYMQKLYDRIKDRTDLAIVTLNVDDSVGLVEPFMAENKYTFPVVFAEAFWSKLDVEKAIPTNWVVDSGGKVRLEHVGFDDATGDKWVDSVLAQLDGKATATAAAN